MRLKKETHTEEYYVYNCPLCGKETKLRLHEGANEQEPCSDCYTKLYILKQYEENKYLLGAVISDIEVCSYMLDSFTITTVDGKKYTIRTTPDDAGSSGLEIEEVEEEAI